MTRCELRWVGLGGALVALALVAGARPSAAAHPAQTTPTVVVEPTAAPVPVFLPRLLKRYDPRLPGPIESRFEGYVVKLTREGREGCAPATHVLQTKPEGFPGAVGLAVLYSPHPGADYNLDFYIGEYVEVFGFGGMAPTACRTLSWQLLSVEAIRRIVLPPGAVR
jgi:hypothetical protein